MIRPELAAVLLVMSLGLLAALWRLHRGPSNYDLVQLIAEPDGSRLSLSRIGQLVALGVSSWGFVSLVMADRLTEWYYGTYMIAWTGTAIATRILSARAQPTPSPT